jgi:hypothetical protein
MRNRSVITLLLILAFCGGHASAQHQIIARNTNGLQDLQNISAGLLGELHLCTVVESMGDPVDSHGQPVEFSILTNPSNV